MSRRLPLLAEVDPQALHRQRLLDALRGCGVGARMGMPGTPTCLRFQLHTEHGAVVCRVDANDWATVHLPDLVGLDWTSMEPSVIAGLTAVEHPLQFEQQVPGYQQAHALPAAVLPSSLTALPAVQAAEGEVWIESWSGPLPGPARPPLLPAGFALPVSAELGKVALPLQQLKRLHRGDIVLITAPAAQAWRGRCLLFDFHFQTECLVVTHVHLPPAADVQTHAASLPSDEYMPDIRGLGELPLELHVLLCRIDLSLAELAAMREGSVVTLPDRASDRVQLLHNGVRIATGELVQVGDRLGVKLAQVPKLT